MNQSYVIKGAILSEKTYKQMEAGIYTFLVDSGSTKPLISKAVENQFGVKVTRVNLATKPSKTKRIAGSRKTVKTQNGRKAIVYLAQGQSIEMLAPKTEKGKNKKKETSASKSQPVKEKGGLLSKIKKTKEKTEVKSSAS
jgi:large subunit ribosomal protein L23